MPDAQQSEESRWLALRSTSRSDRAALEAWRSYRQSHASIVRALDRELVIEHGITTRDYEVLLDLAHAPDRKLAMSDLAKSTRLTPSGITRLIDGLVGTGLIHRVRRSSDARVSYAQLTESGYERLRQARQTHSDGIRQMFLERFTKDEIDQLASLLSRLAGAHPDLS
jgi:DNA-binding MarR family transcriptional regulator